METLPRVPFSCHQANFVRDAVRLWRSVMASARRRLDHICRMRGAVAAVAFGVIALLSANAETWPQPAPDYSALLAVSDRSDADRQADKRRHPATICGFRGRAPRTSTPHRKPSDLRARRAPLHHQNVRKLKSPAVAIARKCLAQLEVPVWGG